MLITCEHAQENLSTESKKKKENSRISKKKYRNIDVLVIDDIQFIGGKPATE
ncbi:unnamed protein product, partial [marine sediment metagenome]